MNLTIIKAKLNSGRIDSECQFRHTRLKITVCYPPEGLDQKKYIKVDTIIGCFTMSSIREFGKLDELEIIEMLERRVREDERKVSVES